MFEIFVMSRVLIFFEHTEIGKIIHYVNVYSLLEDMYIFVSFNFRIIKMITLSTVIYYTFPLKNILIIS